MKVRFVRQLESNKKRKKPMKKLMNKLKSLLGIEPKRYNLIYRNAKGQTKLYIVSDVIHKNTFGNLAEKNPNVGFRARVLNRSGEVRSFRYDRIVSLAN
tara:strand:- start:2433 stop:2729 length:297 start_codon:yes stop_codon:yes gene_type:complete